MIIKQYLEKKKFYQNKTTKTPIKYLIIRASIYFNSLASEHYE